MFEDATGVICNRESKDRQYNVKRKKARKDKQATTIGYLIGGLYYFVYPVSALWLHFLKKLYIFWISNISILSVHDDG